MKKLLIYTILFISFIGFTKLHASKYIWINNIVLIVEKTKTHICFGEITNKDRLMLPAPVSCITNNEECPSADMCANDLNVSFGNINISNQYNEEKFILIRKNPDFILKNSQKEISRF